MKNNVLSIQQKVSMDVIDRNLIRAVQSGLPLCEKPFELIARQLGLDEATVLKRLERLKKNGAIKRFGVVVRHHELGYHSNAMLVFDIADEDVSRLGHCIGQFTFVTLCYRRPRVLPDWPYNLFCMIHGKDRDNVLEHVAQLVQECGLENIPRAVLFSKRRFKQRGAIYQKEVVGKNSSEVKACN